MRNSLTKKLASSSAAVLVSVLSAAFLSGGEPDAGTSQDTAVKQRLPIPQESERAVAAKFLGPILDISAKDASSRSAAAKKLLDHADEVWSGRDSIRDKAAVQYVLLERAREVAEKAGDATVALDAVNKIAERYEVDRLKLLMGTLEQTARAARVSERRAKVAEAALEASDEAVAVDDYTAAKDFAYLALRASRGMKDPSPGTRARYQLDRVKLLAKRYGEVEDSVARLRDDPKDQKANLAFGEFLCFVKGNWRRGLPCLVKGEDWKLAGLAKSELEVPRSVADKVSLAEQWIRFSEDNKKRLQRRGFQKQVHLRARHWLEDALTECEGLTKVRVENLLQELPAYGLVIHLKALIDGTDELHVTQHELLWKHGGWKWPKNVEINGQKWDPKASPKSSLPRGMRRKRFSWSEAAVSKLRGRGRVSHKVDGNGLIISLRDTASGADNYEVKVSIPFLD